MIKDTISEMADLYEKGLGQRKPKGMVRRRALIARALLLFLKGEKKDD